MKACFYLQRRLAPIGHTIIKHLKDLGMDSFCAYAEPKTAYEFLMSQKDIKYSKILVNGETIGKYKTEKLDLEYLRWLEKEYGLPNLWPYLYIDRILMNGQFLREYPYQKPYLSQEEMLRAIQAAAKEIIAFLDSEKPNFLFMMLVSSLGSMLLYHIAKKRGVKTWILFNNRVDDQYVLTEDYNKFTGVEEIFMELQSGNRSNLKEKEAKEFLEKFRNKPAPFIINFLPSNSPVTKAKQLKFLLPPNFLRVVKWFIKASISYLFTGKREYSDQNPILMAWDKIKRKIRNAIGYSDLYSKPDINDNFCFFPLHQEPEIALNLFAPIYTNQINLIQQIARSLPIDFKLYVKEHPHMVGFRTRAYYKELLKIPNIKIIDPSITSFDLIKHAKLISVITSTTGMEAIFLKKPVIVFGNVFYNSLSMVKKCHDFEKLPYLVKEQLENFRYDEKELINFISAILEDSIKVNIFNLWRIDLRDEVREKDEGLKRLAEAIIKKSGLKI